MMCQVSAAIQNLQRKTRSRMHSLLPATDSHLWTCGSSLGRRAGQQINWGSWSALDVATGKIIWQTPDPTPGTTDRGSVSVANGVLYAGSDAGQMYALEASSGNVLWSFQSGEQSSMALRLWTAPCIGDQVTEGSHQEYQTTRYLPSVWAAPRRKANTVSMQVVTSRHDDVRYRLSFQTTR